MRTGRIKITTSYMVWIILGIVSIGGLLISGLRLPNVVYYLADAFNLLLFGFALKRIRLLQKIQNFGVLRLIFWVFVVSVFAGVVGNEVSILLVLWGARNIFRYVLFFMSCVVLLSGNHIESFFEALPKIFWFNFIVTLMQFVLGYRQDYLGGIFGIAQGCNGALTIFINIVIAYVASQYLNRNWTLKRLVPYALAYFVIVALSETKGNFVFFVLMVLIALMVSRKSMRTVALSLMAIVATIIGINILARYFPDSVAFLLDWDKANEYMNSSYFGTTTFTRNSIISVVNKYFFETNLWLYFFGYGIGACDMSQFFESAFYSNYGYMNYRQYSSAIMILQNGYIGFVLFGAFFVAICVISVRNSDKYGRKYSPYMTTAVCISIFAIADSFYATIFIDMGYWIFFIMSVPFILLKSSLYDERLYRK